MGAGVPASYATLAYNGLHTFFLVGADGSRRPFRYSWVPVRGEHLLAEPAGTVDLTAELAARLEGPPEDAAFDLLVHLGTADDPTGDPTAIWPERPVVVAGRLQLDTVVADAEPVIFDPTNVVDGVGLDPDDEILQLRRSVYGLSYATRTST
jgi:catalase